MNLVAHGVLKARAQDHLAIFGCIHDLCDLSVDLAYAGMIFGSCKLNVTPYLTRDKRNILTAKLLPKIIDKSRKLFGIISVVGNVNDVLLALKPKYSVYLLVSTSSFNASYRLVIIPLSLLPLGDFRCSARI